ncbi:MAG: putative RecB family exonuclease [Bacillota bacterium]|nr:MAG: putative RecB family exonuclease [Bacillota bacterium]
MIELKVTDIKQYFYCPRIVYFCYVMPVDKKVSFKMSAGTIEHIRFETLEKRRKVIRYGLEQAERRFRVPLYSKRLGLRGVLDMLLINTQGEMFPVEHKATMQRLGLNHKYQLAAYAILVEDEFSTQVRRGFLYASLSKELREVEVDHSIRRALQRVLVIIRNMISTQRLPKVLHDKSRCGDCEYRLYCLDVR